MRKWIAAALIIVFFLPLSAAKVGIGSGVSIQQPDNNLTVNSTGFNVSSVGVYSSATEFSGSNFSVQNTDGTAATASLDFYNPDAGNRSYVTNYTASTTQGNTLTFEFSDLWINDTYEAYHSTTKIERKETTGSGLYTFSYSNWDTQKSFSLYNSNNSVPEISSVHVDINETSDNREVTLGLSTNDENDLASYDGLSSVSEFTNSTLKSSFSFPFLTDVSVSDRIGQNVTRQIALDRYDSGHIQDEGESSNLSQQYPAQEYYLWNEASKPVNYTVVLSVPGTLDSSTVWNGKLSPSENASFIAGNHGDWINETQYGFTVPGEVTLSKTYTGSRDLETVEGLSVYWPDINTTGFVDTPNTCTQSNYTSISVSADETRNRSVGFSCDPGDVGSPSQTIVNESGYERIWYNTTLTVSSNLTENSSLVWPIDESNLKDFIERDGGSLEAQVNGKSSDVTAVDGAGQVYVNVEDDYGNSSLHKGQHSASLTYTIGDSDDSDGGGTGGGTGGTGGTGGAGEEEGNETPEYDIEFTTQDYYTVAPGSTSKIYFTVWNYAKDENTARIETTDTPACSYFTVQSNFVGDKFSKSTSLKIPGTQQDLGGGGADVILMAKVKLPNRTEIQEKGLGDTFTCNFDTGAGNGEAAPLNLTVQAVDTTPRWVKGVRQLVPDLPATSLLYREEICLPEAGGKTSGLKQVQRYLEEGQCSGSLHSVPLPTGEASALIFGAFVFAAGVTRFRGKVI